MRGKLTVLLLAGAMCLLGATVAQAYNEAPMLRVKVAAGELPPVEKRLPIEPSVLEPLEEVGQYGGVIHVFALDNSPWQDLCEETERGTYLGRLRKDGTVEGDLAKGFEIADDPKSLIIHLREGAKWSDGYPFTADDIVFMFEAMHWHPDVETVNWLGMVTDVEKIDDYTVRLITDTPRRLLLKMIEPAGGDWCAYAPKHYLKKWHIDYNPKANELAKKEGFDSWVECFAHHYSWDPLEDLNKPTMQPWIMTEFTSTRRVFVRNPYYWKVDTAGNQLPYIDKIVSTIVNPEVYQMKIISGEADVAFMNTSFENYSLYKENEKEGGYTVTLIPGTQAAAVAFGVNLNHPDPVLRKIYQDVRFRQALSLAINREEINEVIYFGMGVPRQCTILPTASFYKEKWAQAFAQYDPDEANRLLDEMGLTERDKDGFRLRPDGKRLEVIIEYCAGGEMRVPVTLLELVKEYWEDVGISVILRSADQALFWERIDSPDHGIVAGERIGEEVRGYLIDSWDDDWYIGSSDHSWAPLWGEWLQADSLIKRGRATLEDYGEEMPGEEPPAEIKQLFQWGEERAQVEFRSPEYKKIMQKIFDWHAKNLVMIGTVGMIPVPYIAKNNIGNVPKAYNPAGNWPGDLNYYAEQLFFKTAKNNPE